MKKKTPSAERSRELIESIDQSLADLGAQLEGGNSEQLNQFLEFLSRFHRYSIGNLLLIFAQRPDAVQVAGFNTWKDLGRHVIKGEKGIAILAPMVKRSKDQLEDNPAESEEAQKSRIFGFRPVHVFDVSQTDGDPLPEFAEVTGDPSIYTERLRQHIRSLGIELREEPIAGGAMGMSEGGTITVLPELPPAKMTAVLVHETAHEILHRGDRRAETTAQIRETEAEAVAYAVCRRIGLEPNSSSSDYIRLYGGSQETLQHSLEHIRACTAGLLQALLNNGVHAPGDQPRTKTQKQLF